MKIKNLARDVLGIGGQLNGVKTIIGAALVVAAAQVTALNDLIPLLPNQSDTIQTTIEVVKTGISVLNWTLSILGNGFLAFGLGHKAVKLIK